MSPDASGPPGAPGPHPAAHEPDAALGRRLHFACGALFGIGAGFLLALRWELRGAVPFLLLLAAMALACGRGAARWGDRFWHWLGGNHERW